MDEVDSCQVFENILVRIKSIYDKVLLLLKEQDTLESRLNFVESAVGTVKSFTSACAQQIPEMEGKNIATVGLLQVQTALERITAIEKKHKIESEPVSRKSEQFYIQLVAKAKELEVVNLAKLESEQALGQARQRHLDRVYEKDSKIDNLEKETANLKLKTKNHFD